MVNTVEKRWVNIEVSLFRSDEVKFKSPFIAEATANKSSNFANVAQAETNDLEIAGVVQYPAGK